MHFQIALLYIATLSNVLLGSLVFYRSYTRMYGWFFALIMIGVAAWALGDIMILQAHSSGMQAIAERIFYVAPLIIPLNVWFFALVYPNRKPNNILLLAGSAALLLVGGTILVDPQLIVRSVSAGAPLNVPHPRLPWFYGYTAYFSLIFICAYIALFTAFRKETDRLARVQLKYTFYGVIFASVPALFTNLTLPSRNISDLIWLGPLFTTVFVVVIGISIVQHKMFDIRLVVARSLGYLLSLVSISALYGFVVFGVAKLLFGLKFTVGTQILLSLTTALAAISFSRLKKGFDRFTNRLFYRDAYDPQDLFDRLNQQLVSTLDINRLLHGTVDLLAETFKADFCMIGLKEVVGGQPRIIGTQKPKVTPVDIAVLRQHTIKHHNRVMVVDRMSETDQPELKQILVRNDIAVLVRLTPNIKKTEEGLGLIALGAKRSGNMYNQQDIRVLDTIANELVIAIQNALHFEEIRDFNQTLQAEVNEATNKLRRSNERLKQLDETKDEFISMASHQLRTPLTSVKGYLSMVLEGDVGKLNKQQEEMLSQSYASSQRMVYLISDLLNLSRLNTGKFVIESTPVDLREVVRAEMGQVVETAKSRNITLTYKNPDSFPEMMLDETKIHQVVMNFMDNAIYYTPSGGHVDIELIDTPSAVEYRVVDNGIGVPRDKQKHLFTKFYRADNARQARPDGTGLGLYMAKKVIAAQGGAIIFESVEGKGSIFGFRFSKAKHVVSKAEPITTEGRQL